MPTKNHQDLHLVFIDYQRAFDKVQHTELFKVLSNIKVNGKDMQVVRSIWYNQLAPVQLTEDRTNN